MRAFIPAEITTAHLVDSSIPVFDVDEPQYVDTKVYDQGEIVTDATGVIPKIYESLVANNQGNDPALSPTKWIEKSYSNRFRMFYFRHGHISIGASPLTVTIRPRKRIDAVMLGGLVANNVSVQVNDGVGGDVIFSEQKNLLTRYPTNPYEWFFVESEQTRLYDTFDIPVSPDPVITITLTSNDGICQIEYFATGQSVFLGDEEWDGEAEDQSFTNIEYDQFGTLTELSPVEGVPEVRLELALPASHINRVNQFKRLANRRVVAWAGMRAIEAYQESFSLFGVYQDFNLTAANHKEATFSISIKGA
jgi:hypothetical protein